jgi:N-acetylglucosaminyldiphosphoundecaprenol N-acetyl-beta-D-mannosaminyltransferase
MGRQDFSAHSGTDEQNIELKALTPSRSSLFINDMNNKRIKIFGLYIDNLSMEETLEKIDGFILSGNPHQHVVVNVNKVTAAAKDHKIRDIINSCELINVDGMPVIWASRIFGKPLKERVTGVDLFYRLLERASDKGYKVYFLGASAEVIESVVETSKNKYPGLKIAGWRDGYWKAQDEESVASAIKDSGADILFVAVPSPKKEIFLNKYVDFLGVPFLMGVGGTFDVFSGKIKRAPLWMQKIGLEWFYRFIQEPVRLFSRYFFQGFEFICLVVREFVKPQV